MTGFKPSYTISGNQVKITFGREITRETEFPKLDLSKVEKLVLDFDKTEYVNSGGVRNWIIWTEELNKHPSRIEIALNNVRFVLVKQEATTSGLFPRRSKVSSFYIPFVCENCRSSVNKRVELRKDASAEEFKTTLKNELQPTPCPTCQEAMELDALEEYYMTLVASYVTSNR